MLSSQEWRQAQVRAVQDVAEDVRMVTFTVSGAGFSPSPGSHTQIRVHIDGARAVRSYTVVPSEAGTLAIAVKLHANSRGGSAFVWTLQPGDAVELTVPENRFELSWRASRYLLVAGGIGVTPIFGMALALRARNRPLRMLYGAHRKTQMAFLPELSDCLGSDLATFEQEKGEAFDLDAEIAALPADAEAYVCGPIGLLDAMHAAWRRNGRMLSRLRYEVFGDSGRFAEEPFEVRLAGNERSLSVRSDQSMLEALIAAGVDVIYDCQRGECGLCAVEVLACTGEIDHRDVFFSAAEKQESKRMCSCVSRARGGALIIDTGYRVENDIKTSAPF